MQDYMYSVIAFVAMTIHLIINYDLITARKVSTAEGMRYRCFLFWTLAFYLTDGGWGIFAGLLKHTGLQRWLIVLYVDTGICFIALALSVLMWCRFVITYLDFSKWPARVLAWSGYALFAFNLAALAVNIFNNSFFYFDVDGRYISGPMRKLAFYLLAAFNVLTAFCVLVKAFRNRGSVRRRSMMVFLFCFTMTAAIVIQILWPLLPLYALGSLIGGCFLHVFVIEGERNELRRAVIEREQTAKHMAELENALERARAAEKARSMFFSIVSHDIRTPLNAILGYSELLESGVRSPTERSEALKSIRASGTTLLQLVNDVLDLAKMDAGKLTLRPEPVHLAKLTDEVFASFRLAASGKGIELVNRTASAPTIMLDEHRFRQILFNLVGNAVKFTAKGSVTVSASFTGTVGAKFSGTVLEVVVSDTGCGIPPEMLTHILDPFVQVQDPSHSADRAGGSGLGLSICRRLVETMGGELSSVMTLMPLRKASKALSTSFFRK